FISLAFTSEAAVAEALAQLEAQGMEVPPEMLELYTGTGFGVASALFAICFSFFIAAILGAIGGAIYGATQRGAAAPPSYTPPASPPPTPRTGPRVRAAADTGPGSAPDTTPGDDPWQETGHIENTSPRQSAGAQGWSAAERNPPCSASMMR